MIVIQTIFEVMLVAAVICGFVFESKIAAWEGKMFSKIKRKHHDRKAAEKRKSFVVIETK